MNSDDFEHLNPSTQTQANLQSQPDPPAHSATEQEQLQNPKKHRLRPLWISLGVIASVALFAFAAYLIFQFTNSGDRYNTSGSEAPMEFDLKPIIYLYPTTETEISIKLGHPEKLTTDYPTYQNGWRVLASPSGNLTDLNSGREFYSLYWEGQGHDYSQEISDGFVVKGENAAEFLEEKLEILGLDFREREEFIIYWLPKLEQNPYNYIRFATTSEINAEMPLAVTPEPDTTIRVRMLFRSLDSPQTVPEQTLTPAPARAGFTLVEWGGVDLNN